MANTSMLQLAPPIPVITPLGEGWALLVIDYGPQWNTCWAVQLHQTGQLKHFDSNDIRFPHNHTYATPRTARHSHESANGVANAGRSGR